MFESIFYRIQHRNHLLLTAPQDGSFREFCRDLRLHDRTDAYVYSAELVPTVTRTLGVGCGSMCARVGSLLSPFIALLVGTLL